MPRQLSQRAILRASEGEAHGCAFQRRKDARSRHQRLFVENVGKTGKDAIQVGLVAICTPIFTKYTPCLFLGDSFFVKLRKLANFVTILVFFP